MNEAPEPRRRSGTLLRWRLNLDAGPAARSQGTHLLALVVITQQRVGQGAQGGKQDAVGDTEGQNHVEVPGECGEPGPQAEGQVRDEIQRPDAEVLLQLLQDGCQGRGR